MKIGVLTFHDGMNHGGFLQAYALARRLREWGAQASIIHYRNRTHWLQEYRGLLIRFNPANIARNAAKIWAFKRAQNRMPLTRFTTSVERVAAMAFDAIVVGSDIVWNFQWPFLGGDRIYFGQGLEQSRLVAYAPSFGEAASAEQLPSDIVAALRGFHALSVRDDRSLALLRKALPGRDARTVLDPTFLVDWKSETKPCRLPDRFLLVYAFQLRPDEIDAARRYASEAGLTTVAVGYRQSWCDQQMVSADPFEYLHCFQRASSVLTSTFHGTLFSLQFERAFYTSCNDAIEPKTRGLLGQLGLENRLRRDAAGLPNMLETSPDYPMVGQRIAALKMQSMTYLKDALEL